MKALIILLVLPLQLLSQDISGIWTGWVHTRGNDLLYELVISENKGKLSGYSLTIFTIDGIENVGVKSLILKKKKGNISIEDDQLIYNNYTTPPKRIKLFGFLSLNMEDSIMTLSGKFHTRLLDYRSSDNDSYTGTITLQRQKNSSKTRLISQLDKMNLSNTLSFIQPKTQEKEKDTAPLKKEDPLLAVISKPKENQPDSVSIKEMGKNIQSPVAETKLKEATIPVASVKEPERLSPVREQEKQIDSVSIKELGKNIQATIVETKLKEATIPVASVKEPERLPPARKQEKQIDSVSIKKMGKNIQATIVETKLKEGTTPVASVKEPERLSPVRKQEKQSDSISQKLTEKNIRPVAEIRPGIPQLTVIKTIEDPVTVNAAAAIDKRKTAVIQNVFYRSDSLILSLYDNGTVDGDTVSVVLNGKIIIAKKGLNENALRVVIQMTPDLGDSLLLTMYAENLGSISPNTGLLIIQDGNDRSEIRFEGDMQNNSAVILRRKR